MTPEQACVPTIEGAGFDPEDVRYILQSHLHLDHTGALAAIDRFPNAEVVATRERLASTRHAPDWYARARLHRRRLHPRGCPLGPARRHRGRLRRVRRRPRSAAGARRATRPGHQSFEVKLANSGTFLLTIDAAYTTDHWKERALPGFLASAVDTVRSVRKLHHIARRSDATVVTGHDPDAWPKFKHSPGSYD